MRRLILGAALPLVVIGALSPASAEVISYTYSSTFTRPDGSTTNGLIYTQYDLAQGYSQMSSTGGRLYSGGNDNLKPNFASGYFLLNGIRTDFASIATGVVRAENTYFGTSFRLVDGLPSPLTKVDFSSTVDATGIDTATTPGTYNGLPHSLLLFTLYTGSSREVYTSYATSVTVATIVDPPAGPVPAVPLPAAAPLFGAALLICGAIGRGLDRKGAAAA